MFGHESIGRVLGRPDRVGMKPGDLVVGVVRRPDPVPCSNCAVGESDMCRNGQYTEHGIKALHGLARQPYRADPQEGSATVPNGNGADQYQLDACGEVLDGLHVARATRLAPLSDDAWSLTQAVIKFARSHGDEPDNGVWEIREPPALRALQGDGLAAPTGWCGRSAPRS